MSQTEEGAALPIAASLPLGLTPTGTQSAAVLFRRRLLMTILNVATWLGLAGVFGYLLSFGGWTVLDLLLFAAFLVSTPWTVLGFWNAIVGFWLLHGGRDPTAEVSPYALRAGADDPVTARVAVLMTIRNEDPGRAFARLKLVKRELDATPDAGRFAYFVLSDTNLPEIAAGEEACFAAWQAEAGEGAQIRYRRRTDNAGFKAGNVRDFLETMSDGFDIMIGLDADSLMGARFILRLVRIMQANPRLGILQSLVVGLPSRSAFARLFQFGMRHGMRSYTMGAAWWSGDCGPYWGHNAAIRIAPFRAHCHLPVLPGRPPLGGTILSHDQIEAVLMRRAGYEVRVLPEEGESYEENPPHLMEFTRRDLRWCQGNMQYWRLLTMPDLRPMSRFQMAWAILMYLGAVAWVLFMALAALKVFDVKHFDEPFPASLGLGLFAATLLMSLTPKIAGVADILVTPAERRRYGGARRLLGGAALEFLFGLLLGPVLAVRVAIFVIGLAFGRAVGWQAQARDAAGLSWRSAATGLWPQAVFGLFLLVVVGWGAPAALWWSVPVLAGLFLAMPLAVLTADPRFGRWLTARGICALPEEIEPPAQVVALTQVTNVA